MSVRVNFPPRTSHLEQVGVLLDLFSTVVTGRTAVYVSAPVTSGKRYAAWRSRLIPELSDRDPTYRRLHRESVVIPNREDVRSLVEELRRGRTDVVIDPTSFGEVPGWTQDDYRYFWGRTIERFAQTVIFVDGWEHSDGCSYEFLVAQASGARTLKQDGTNLGLAEAIRLIAAAVEHTRDSLGRADFRENVRSELTRISGGLHKTDGQEQAVRD